MNSNFAKTENSDTLIYKYIPIDSIELHRQNYLGIHMYMRICKYT